VTANRADQRILRNSIPFSPDAPADFFLQFPPKPAVFALRGADENAEPYVSKTSDLRRRLIRLLAPAESQSRRLNLRDRVARIEYSLTGSDFESGVLLYHLLREEFPETYARRLRLHHAALIRLNLENAYPRAYVTNRLGKLTGKSLYYGPFRSRAVAEKYMNDSLDLFKIRRCTFELNPDPSYPGCVYSEMKMCLAPCFKGCTDEEYAAEVERVQAWFDSGGESLIAEYEAERDRLSADLQFEAAAEQHGRIAKLKSVASGADELTHRIDQLDALIIQRSAEPHNVVLFRFSHGALCGPVQVNMSEPGEAEPPPEIAEPSTSQPEPLDKRVHDAIESLVPPGARTATHTSEELALVKRWYHRTHKTGEIVIARRDGKLSLRKVVNACERVLRGQKPSAESTPVEPGPQDAAAQS
jgi:excinuclease UvrABC nuclease subunit